MKSAPAIKLRKTLLLLQPNGIPQRVIANFPYQSSTHRISYNIPCHMNNILIPAQGMVVESSLPNRKTSTSG